MGNCPEGMMQTSQGCVDSITTPKCPPGMIATSQGCTFQAGGGFSNNHRRGGRTRPAPRGRAMARGGRTSPRPTGGGRGGRKMAHGGTSHCGHPGQQPCPPGYNSGMGGYRKGGRAKPVSKSGGRQLARGGTGKSVGRKVPNRPSAKIVGSKPYPRPASYQN